MNNNKDDQLLTNVDHYNRLVAALNDAMTENRKMGRKIDASDRYWAALDALRRHATGLPANGVRTL